MSRKFWDSALECFLPNSSSYDQPTLYPAMLPLTSKHTIHKLRHIFNYIVYSHSVDMLIYRLWPIVESIFNIIVKFVAAFLHCVFFHGVITSLCTVIYKLSPHVFTIDYRVCLYRDKFFCRVYSCFAYFSYVLFATFHASLVFILICDSCKPAFIKLITQQILHCIQYNFLFR
jgi:hypothetical protein